MARMEDGPLRGRTIERLEARAAFTPGPWHVRIMDESIGSVDDENDNTVAQAGQVSADDQRNGSPVRRANTYLIAAAPDLFEALELYISTYCDTQSHPTAVQEALCMIKARDALSKARGE